MDGVQPLLGKGWVGFDMRDPTRLVARKPGDLAGGTITTSGATPVVAQPAKAKPAGTEAKQVRSSIGQG
jgi:cell division protein FtsQ